ncbi:MAG: ABC transporter ATP-binding protein [Johnsonella sp.]|nr:ABC transporter ATP-binding protein [Johnsonella sp.]
MQLIRTEGLSKEFVRGRTRFLAVDHVDFSIDEGEYVYITGRSGSGKTSFLNLLSGISEATSGEIFVGEKKLSGFGDLEKSRYRNSYIGYVPQFLGTLPNLTVRENIGLVSSLFEKDETADERALAMLDLMEISYLKDEFPRSLSGGELKRVLLARALMNRPKILIADEPTADLDSETMKNIMRLLQKINQEGTALLIVTHETDILDMGDKTYLMDDGKLKPV